MTDENTIPEPEKVEETAVNSDACVAEAPVAAEPEKKDEEENKEG